MNATPLAQFEISPKSHSELVETRIAFRIKSSSAATVVQKSTLIQSRGLCNAVVIRPAKLYYAKRRLAQRDYLSESSHDHRLVCFFGWHTSSYMDALMVQ